MLFDTPSWCGEPHHLSLPSTMSTMKLLVLVGFLSVAVAFLLSDGTVVRCLRCLSDGIEELTVDDVQVLEVGCLTDGHEAFTDDEAEVVIVDCRPDGVEAFALDDVADRWVDFVVVPF